MTKNFGLIPLGDRVVILPDTPAERKGGIFILEKWQRPSDRGIVVAVGLGLWDEDDERVPVQLEVGMRVLFSRVRGMQVTLPNAIVLILRELDVLAVLP